MSLTQEQRVSQLQQQNTRLKAAIGDLVKAVACLATEVLEADAKKRPGKATRNQADVVHYLKNAKAVCDE